MGFPELGPYAWAVRQFAALSVFASFTIVLDLPGLCWACMWDPQDIVNTLDCMRKTVKQLTVSASRRKLRRSTGRT